MPIKLIVSSLHTLHAPTADYKPIKLDGNGGQVDGNYDVKMHPVGTPVPVEEKEAERLLARFPATIREATPAEKAALSKAAKSDADKGK